MAEDLQQQVSLLARQVELLAKGLQGDRLRVAEGLNHIREVERQRWRGPEQDYGPSR